MATSLLKQFAWFEHISACVRSGVNYLTHSVIMQYKTVLIFLTFLSGTCDVTGFVQISFCTMVKKFDIFANLKVEYLENQESCFDRKGINRYNLQSFFI